MIPTMGRDLRPVLDGVVRRAIPAHEEGRAGAAACPLKDLPSAVNHLNDEELDRLLTVALAEARRRGKSLPSAQTSRTRQRSEGTA